MKLKSIINIIFVMVFISGFSGFILALNWNASFQKIKNNEDLKLKQAFFEINPQISTFNIVITKNQTIYYGLDKFKKTQCLFFIGQGNGFQGNIKIVICTNPDLTQILGLKIIEQTETPGLGSEIIKKNFVEQFKNISLSSVIKCIKNSAQKENSEVKAISGATISSKAVVEIINNTVAEVRELGKKQ
jgi:electron transport complex protein RnfG